MKIGCVGLGNIGRHLATNLQRAGFDLVGHDLQRSAAHELVAAGAAWADSPAIVAEWCDAVVTCLPSVRAITQVVAGENGLLEGFRSDSTWIDIVRNVPLGRWGTAEEIADVACFLASDKASYVNGQIICGAGGMANL